MPAASNNAPRQVQAYLDQVASARLGERNSTLNRCAFIAFKIALRTTCCSAEDVMDAMTAAARTCGLTDAEATATLHSARTAAYR